MNDISDGIIFSEWKARDQNAFVDQLDDEELGDFFYTWSNWARTEQLAPQGQWSTWMVMAGRGFGKTRAGAEWVRSIVEIDADARFALVGANFAETRMIMVEGESGLLSISPNKQRPVWEPSLKRLQWPMLGCWNAQTVWQSGLSLTTAMLSLTDSGIGHHRE